MPHLLSNEEKVVRVNISKELLKILKRRTNNVVTGDESWFWMFQLASKQQNMVWLGKNEPQPDVRQSFRSKKRMFTIFINNRQTVLVDLLPEGGSITANYYCNTILPKVFQNFNN